MIFLKSFILVLMMSVHFACSEDKPNTPTSKASQDEGENPSINNGESENAVQSTQTRSTEVNGSNTTTPPGNPPGQNVEGSSNTPSSSGKSCPAFPDISSPINGGGGNCSDACVRKLKAAHQYLTSLGSKVVKPKDVALKTGTVASSFYKELNASGKSLGCNPLEGKSYK